MCVSRIHYFNPGHETAVLSGRVNYMPPRQVRIMSRDLACLPLWYAKPHDWVWVEDLPQAEEHAAALRPLFPQLPPVISAESFRHLPDSMKYEAAPWGLSPQSLHHYKRLLQSGRHALAIPEWLDDYKRLTGRQTARKVLERLKELLPEMTLPELPVFCRSAGEVEAYAQAKRPPYILKTPFSSSGRGLLWLYSSELTRKDRQWIEGAVRKQGEISIEPALDKQQDWAMEFESDGKGSVAYRGLSVFGTAGRGAYTGNLLGPEAFREDFILAHIPSSAFMQVKESLEVALSEIFGYLYAGCIGVDMLLYRRPESPSWHIHPCVEINMRQTMGMVAVQLSEQFLEEGRTGRFAVDYAGLPGEAQEEDREMRRRHPLVTAGGKIRSGYLSLCPVSSDTHYRAYVVIT